MINSIQLLIMIRFITEKSNNDQNYLHWYQDDYKNYHNWYLNE